MPGSFHLSFFVIFGDEVTKISCHFQAKTVQLIFFVFRHLRKTKLGWNAQLSATTLPQLWYTLHAVSKLMGSVIVHTSSTVHGPKRRLLWDPKTAAGRKTRWKMILLCQCHVLTSLLWTALLSYEWLHTTACFSFRWYQDLKRLKYTYYYSIIPNL